jgi:hypothetical protein
MSGEVEASQAELDLKALQGFREGNQDLDSVTSATLALPVSGR